MVRDNVQYIEELGRDLVEAFVGRGPAVYFWKRWATASQAQHFATELTGRFRHNRRALPPKH